MGKVGIIFGIEVSRLARNKADWYQLLDLCAVTDTLIADGDGLYHPADFNDRLVLGLNGTMSEAELHLIRHRLTAGLRHKAAKGELRQGLPVGFVYDDNDRVILDPNEAVIEAIATVFRRFDEIGSARQVMLSLRGDGVFIPRRPTGAKRVGWAPATLLVARLPAAASGATPGAFMALARGSGSSIPLVVQRHPRVGR